ncbi:hypothetical protein evm_007535 [Chilo suppressalis]|nr:hypothetical protein evm_007535 [Chilo suppressalis]
MAKFSLLCVAIVVSATQCAVLNIAAGAHERIARSPCYTCGGQQDPPPPPVLQTENWSGLARSADGLHNAVFSGAAAAANQGAQTAGEAFSLASSTVNGVGAKLTGGHTTGNGGTGSADASIGADAGISSGIGAKVGISADIRGNDELSKGRSSYGNSAEGSYKESRYSYHSGNVRNYGDENLQQNNKKESGFGSSSYADQNGSLSKVKENIAGTSGLEQSGRTGINEKELFEGYHNSGSQRSLDGQAGKYGTSGTQDVYLVHDGANSESEARYQGLGIAANNNFNNQERRYESGSHRGQGGYGAISSSQSGSFGQHRAYEGYGHGSNEASYGGKGRGDFGYQQSRANELQYGSSGLPAGIQSGAEAQQLQASGFETSGREIYGAENLQKSRSDDQALITQGDSSLKAGEAGSSSVDAEAALSGALNLASQGLKTAQQSGCATCGKGGYALSNAKSYSGSAVALSIGG